MENPPRCPRCHSDEVLPIVYGLPGPELTEASLAGRVALGGCVLFPDAPDRLCRSCRHRWRDLEGLLTALPDEPITIDKGHAAPAYRAPKPKNTKSA